MDSQPGKNSKQNRRTNSKANKAKPDSLFIIKALFGLSVICAGLLIAYVLMNIKTNPFEKDAVLANGDNVAKAGTDNKPKESVMEKALKGDTIYENIFIQDVDVSGLTKEEAVKKLEKKFNSDIDSEITFDYNGEKSTETFSNFGAKYNIDEAVAEAFDCARTGELEERYEKLSAIKKNAVKIPLKYVCDELLLSDIVTRYTLKYDVAAKEPELSRVDGEFVTKQGASGISIDKDKMISDIRAVLESKKSGVVVVSSAEVKPKYKAEEFAKATDLVGSFTTNFAAGATNRNQNIITAASKINNFVLMPGETFSTNKQFGETTYENGYRVAATYLGGKIVDGMGGGMCQVSTTLYMAVLYSEIEVVERANHSMKVGYADYGFDATLAGDYIDLKFKNNTDYPITIESVLTNKSITVNIYGFETRSAARKLKFENSLVSTTQPEAEKVTPDPALPLNKRAVDVDQKIGYKYELYKLIYENDVFVDKKRVNTSTYRPVRGEVRIGTGPPEQEVIPEQSPEPIVQTPPDVMDPFPDPTVDDAPFMP